MISTALNTVLEQLQAYGLESELKELEGFYDSVKSRVSGLDNDEARQKVITELYEKFFTTAFENIGKSGHRLYADGTGGFHSQKRR